MLIHPFPQHCCLYTGCEISWAFLSFEEKVAFSFWTPRRLFTNTTIFWGIFLCIVFREAVKNYLAENHFAKKPIAERGVPPILVRKKSAKKQLFLAKKRLF